MLRSAERGRDVRKTRCTQRYTHSCSYLWLLKEGPCAQYVEAVLRLNLPASHRCFLQIKQVHELRSLCLSPRSLCPYHWLYVTPSLHTVCLSPYCLSLLSLSVCRAIHCPCGTVLSSLYSRLCSPLVTVLLPLVTVLLLLLHSHQVLCSSTTLSPAHPPCAAALCCTDCRTALHQVKALPNPRLEREFETASAGLTIVDGWLYAWSTDDVDAVCKGGFRAMQGGPMRFGLYMVTPEVPQNEGHKAVAAHPLLPPHCLQCCRLL